ncbi:MAG: hypothetical protein KAW49_17360, partial [Anaerolineae bacterium]|nr:hypothetical protein [Anaerolineae bacterium]
TWSASDNADWLHLQPITDAVQVSVNANDLITDAYQATITVEAEAGVLGSPVQVPVTLIVAELHRCYLPFTLRDAGP